MRIRFQVWAYADARGWDCTLAEIAEAIGEPVRQVQAIVTHAGWMGRLRRPARGRQNTHLATLAFDTALEGEPNRYADAIGGMEPD